MIAIRCLKGAWKYTQGKIKACRCPCLACNPGTAPSSVSVTFSATALASGLTGNMNKTYLLVPVADSIFHPEWTDPTLYCGYRFTQASSPKDVSGSCNGVWTEFHVEVILKGSILAEVHVVAGSSWSQRCWESADTFFGPGPGLDCNVNRSITSSQAGGCLIGFPPNNFNGTSTVTFNH